MTNDTAYEPILTRALNGGSQKVYRFPNGYGASLVDSPFAYTLDGTFELGVIKFHGPGEDDFRLTYDTPVTDDVLGYLTDAEVAETLDKIAALPADEAVA